MTGKGAVHLDRICISLGILELGTGRELEGTSYSERCLNPGRFCHFKIYVDDAGIASYPGLLSPTFVICCTSAYWCGLLAISIC